MRPRLDPAFTPLLALPLALFCVVAILVTAQPSRAFGCISVSPSRSASIPFSLGGDVSISIAVNTFAGGVGAAGDKPSCHAWFYAPLSAFPSLSSRPGTGAIADAIQEQMAEWDVAQCTINIEYENDTQASFSEQELCLIGEYGFSSQQSGRAWSTKSEDYCLSDEDVTRQQEWFEDFELAASEDIDF